LQSVFALNTHQNVAALLTRLLNVAKKTPRKPLVQRLAEPNPEGSLFFYFFYLRMTVDGEISAIWL